VLGPAVGASVVNAFYLAQNWFLDITPPNNNPSWSLNYEAWYYLIFAGAVFARGAWRWPVALLLGACAGPKILILMPCWIAGVWLYRYGNKFTLSNRNAVLLFLASIAAYLVYLALDLNKDIRTELHAHMPALIDSLGWSNRFAGDYLLCGIILANFIAARDMTATFARTMIRYRTTVKWLAGYTLSIYLFHDPLIAVFGHQLEPLHLGRFEALIILALLIPSIMLLASVSELQLSRLRKGLRKLFARNAQPHFSAS
jgi:peptidoglycan/LPS O-acetylase OafA/YrhL